MHTQHWNLIKRKLSKSLPRSTFVFCRSFSAAASTTLPPLSIRFALFAIYFFSVLCTTLPSPAPPPPLLKLELAWAPACVHITIIIDLKSFAYFYYQLKSRNLFLLSIFVLCLHSKNNFDKIEMLLLSSSSACLLAWRPHPQTLCARTTTRVVILAGIVITATAAWLRTQMKFGRGDKQWGRTSGVHCGWWVYGAIRTLDDKLDFVIGLKLPKSRLPYDNPHDRSLYKTSSSSSIS